MRQTNEWFHEAMDSISGAFIFAVVVAVSGAVVGLVGWIAGSYPTAGLLIGCAILSTLVAPLVSGLLKWGVDDVPKTQPVPAASSRTAKNYKRAA